MSGPIQLWDDDGPDGETACIEIGGAGNGDWHLRIIGTNWAGERLVSDSFRASTSGPKCGVVTSCVALLAAVGRGDRTHALTIAKGIVEDLDRKWSRIPNENNSVRGDYMRRQQESESQS